MAVSELGNYEHLDTVSWFVGDKWEGALKDLLQWKMDAFGTGFSGKKSFNLRQDGFQPGR